MLKTALRNWKTSLCGLLSLVGAAAALVENAPPDVAAVLGGPHVLAIAKTVGYLAVGVGLILARDAGGTSLTDVVRAALAAPPNGRSTLPADSSPSSNKTKEDP